MIRLKQFALLLIFSVVLSGCLPPIAGLPFIGDMNNRFILGHLGSRTKVRLKDITFSADRQANQNFATHVHLVLLHDPSLIAHFVNMSAFDYFSNDKFRQLQRDYRSTLSVFPFQIPPGRKIGPVKIDTQGTPVAGFIFASYRNPGKNAMRIPEDRHLTVLLDPNEWQVIPTNGK